MPETRPRRTVPTVVDHLMAAMSLLALSWDDQSIEGFDMTALEGTNDAGKKEKNAIDIRFSGGERFLIFVAPAPSENPT
jgi:hypothetical protein